VREKSEQCIACSKKCIDLKKDNLSIRYILKHKDHVFAAIFPGFVLGYFLVENYPLNPISMIFLEMFFIL
jgi:formylmethanofuran dehydrogenase subunit E-like metal-binding protein